MRLAKLTGLERDKLLAEIKETAELIARWSHPGSVPC